MAVGSLGTLALVMGLLWPPIKTRAPAAIRLFHPADIDKVPAPDMQDVRRTPTIQEFTSCERNWRAGRIA